MNKAAAVCLHEHHRVSLSYLNFAHCVRLWLCEMFFDQIQVITPTVETENRHLITSFHYCPMLFSHEQVDIFWHELCSYHNSNLFPTPLQLFPKLPDQLFGVGVADICGLALKRVTNAD